MQKSKNYHGVKFSARILRAAIEKSRSMAGTEEPTITLLGCARRDESWEFDNVDEFLAMYADEAVRRALLVLSWPNESPKLSVQFEKILGVTTVAIDSTSRPDIESIFGVFEEAGQQDKIALERVKSRPKIFIGHGGDNEWTKLKTHLQDKHNLDVEAYETGARAGHTIRDILESMSEVSSLALLVLTGEDQTADGSVRARQNVIHETGLFQGRLGFDRAFMLVEKGVELGSNFDGIQQIRFDKGRISETFGDVIATVRREFGAI
jgi:predicted nucleotide-binding protein